MHYLPARKDGRWPKQDFFDEFVEEFESWIELGDQIIVTADFNDDVTSKNVNDVFDKLGLWKANIEKRPISPLQPNCNRGRLLIVGICASKSLKHTAARYTLFAELPSNYRALCVDFNIEDSLGSKVLKCIRPNAKRLMLRDPRVIKNRTRLFIISNKT